MLLAAILVLGACRSVPRQQPARPAQHSLDSSPARFVPKGPVVYLLDLVGQGSVVAPSLVAVDVRTGASRTLPLPQVAGGDYPYQLVRVGDGLVFPCNTGTCSIDRRFRGPVRTLGDSWFFVPAPGEHRVWLSRSETVRDQRMFDR